MEKFKKNMLIYLVVWIILSILLVAPVTYTYTQSIISGNNWISEFTTNIVDNILKLPITRVFEDIYVNDFIEGMKIFTIGYFILVVMAIYKTLPKSAFDNIEHGSSDWCLPGEQYKVLSKKEGLLLAKENYLPLTKPGNHNVLIVGRFWCW